LRPAPDRTPDACKRHQSKATAAVFADRHRRADCSCHCTKCAGPAVPCHFTQQQVDRRLHLHLDSRGMALCAVVIDLFSRRAVGWSMNATMTSQLVTDALFMAIWRRGKPDALLHHSDQGSQYTSEQFRLLLADNCVICSMSRSGNVWDNAAMESFFSSLKTERVDRRPIVHAQKQKPMSSTTSNASTIPSDDIRRLAISAPLSLKGEPG
jgi:transposase InsO family protein